MTKLAGKFRDFCGDYKEPIITGAVLSGIGFGAFAWEHNALFEKSGVIDGHHPHFSAEQWAESAARADEGIYVLFEPAAKDGQGAHHTTRLMFRKPFPATFLVFFCFHRFA